MTKRRKAGIVVIILLGLITALIINMLFSSQPFVRWLFISPKYGDVIFNNYNLQDTLQLAENYVEEGEGKSAFIVYNYILEKDPDNIEAYLGLADLYRRITNFKEAERYINEAEIRVTTETQPEIVVDVYYNKALVYYDSFRYEGYYFFDKAIEYFNKALSINSYDVELKKAYDNFIYFYLGQINSSLGEKDLAIENYKNALEANPDDKALYYLMGTEYIYLNDFEKAYEYLKKYEESYGVDFFTLIGFGYYYIEIGDYNKAFEYLTNAEKIRQDQYSLYLLFGEYYEKTNNLEKAKEYYRKAFEVDKYMIQNKESHQTIQRLDINVDDLKEEIEKEKEENYSKVFEL